MTNDEGNFEHNPISAQAYEVLVARFGAQRAHDWWIHGTDPTDEIATAFRDEYRRTAADLGMMFKEEQGQG